MSGSTMKSIAIGAGAALLIIAFGVFGFLMARDSGDDVNSASESSTTVSPTTSTTASSAAPSGELAGTTTPPTSGKQGKDGDSVDDDTDGDSILSGSATAQVDVVTCDSARQGSAFLSNPNTAVTEFVLVDGAAQIALTFNDESIEATIIGQDVARNLAVLRLDTPVEDDADDVLGLTDGQIAKIGELLDAVTANPQPVEPAFCVGSVDLSNIDEIAADLIVADTDHSEIPALQRTYAVYSQSINSGRAENAFGVLGPAITNDNTAAQWAVGQQTSLLWDWRIRSVTDTATGLQVRSVFTSTQDAEFGFDDKSTCTRWDITHDLIEGDFRGRTFWLINRSRATTDRGPQDCVDWSPEVVAKEQLVLPVVGDALARVDRLAGGSVHDWDIGVGPLPDAVESGPETLVVTLESTNEDFDPYLVVLNEFGAVIAENDDRADGSLNSQIELDVASYQVLSVRVSDLTNRGGGDYVITFANAAG